MKCMCNCVLPCNCRHYTMFLTVVVCPKLSGNSAILTNSALLDSRVWPQCTRCSQLGSDYCRLLKQLPQAKLTFLLGEYNALTAIVIRRDGMRDSMAI